MPQWKSLEAKDKLLAAVVASIGTKALNYRDIATYFGEGATYDSIEGQFRGIRKQSEILRQNVANGTQAPAPARGVKAEHNALTTPTRPRTTQASLASQGNGNGSGSGGRKRGSSKKDGVLGSGSGSRISKTTRATGSSGTGSPTTPRHGNARSYLQSGHGNSSLDVQTVGSRGHNAGMGNSNNTLNGHGHGDAYSLDDGVGNMIGGIKEEVVSSESSVIEDTLAPLESLDGTVDLSFDQLPGIPAFVGDFDLDFPEA